VAPIQKPKPSSLQGEGRKVASLTTDITSEDEVQRTGGLGTTMGEGGRDRIENTVQSQVHVQKIIHPEPSYIQPMPEMSPTVADYEQTIQDLQEKIELLQDAYAVQTGNLEYLGKEVEALKKDEPHA